MASLGHDLMFVTGIVYNDKDIVQSMKYVRLKSAQTHMSAHDICYDIYQDIILCYVQH